MEDGSYPLFALRLGKVIAMSGNIELLLAKTSVL